MGQAVSPAHQLRRRSPTSGESGPTAFPQPETRLSSPAELTWTWRADSMQHVRQQRPLGAGHRETGLLAPDSSWAPEELALMETLRGCRVFHFQDTSRDAAVKQQGYTADNRSLHSDARNTRRS